MNGDGYDDILVGAPGYPRGQRADRRSSSVLWLGMKALALIAALDRNFQPERLSGFGEAVSGAGDLNQDGYADLIVGMPGYGTATALSAGAVLHLLGSPDGPGEQADWEIWGAQEYEFLGNSVSPGWRYRWGWV